MDFLSQLRTEGLRIWQQLDRRQQIAVIGLGLGAVVLLFFLTNWARTTEYAPAFSGLREADAGAIVARLKELKIPYQLDNNGSTVLVPSDKVADIRLQLASENLVQGGGVGFELFDQTSFGVTDFVQKINYQRALEGELSRTIDSLAAVDQSRVHIVIPQASLYTEEQKDATASVVLKLKRGLTLDDSQIHGIANLVAGSVEGLKPQNITIIDDAGHVLSDGLSDGSQDRFKASASQLTLQQNYERDLENNVHSYLATVLGQDKSAVRVSVEMNWDQFESNTEAYSPAGDAEPVRSSHNLTETYVQLGPGAGGVPGTDSNIPTYQQTSAITSTDKPYYERSDVTTNYELTKTVEHLVRAPGAVKRLSVSVVLDGEAVPDQAQVEKITDLVSAAVGLNPARGDVLTVSAMPFDKGTLAEDRKAMQEAQQWDMYIQIAKIAAMIIAPIVLLLFLRRLLKRPKPQAALAALPSGGQVQTITEMLRDAAPEQVELPPKPLLVEYPQKKMVREQVFALAKNNPEVLVQLIHTWMEDDKRGTR